MCCNIHTCFTSVLCTPNNSSHDHSLLPLMFVFTTNAINRGTSISTGGPAACICCALGIVHCKVCYPTAGHRSSTALHKVQPCSLSLGYECAQASSDVAAASWHRHSSPRYCCCHCLHMLYNTEKRKVYAYQQSLQRPQIKPQAAPCAQWSYMRGCLPYPAAQCKHGTLSLHLLGSHHAVMSLHPGDQLVGACSCQVICNVAKLDFLLAWHPSTYMAS